MNSSLTLAETIGIAAVIISFIGMIGGFIARDRYIGKQIRDGDEAMAHKLSEHSKHIHDRIDRLKDDTVRISTHDKSVERIEGAIVGLRADMSAQAKAQTDRYDTIIGMLASSKKND